MRRIKIFLASSSELKDERVQFELLIGRENKRLVNQGVFLELVIWEDFRDHFSKDGLQVEYNRAVQECEIFVMLFFTKVGPYTRQEFEAARTAFMTNQRPRIFTYFKDAPMQIGAIREDDLLSLLEFRRWLSELKHYPTVYPNIDWMLLHFRRQLEDYLDNGGLTQPELPSEGPPVDSIAQVQGQVQSPSVGPKKILFLSASPALEAHLQTQEEFRAIRAAMQRGTNRDAYHFVMPEMAVRVEDIVRAMSIKPQFVHFAGHGQQEGILLSDELGASVAMPLAALKLLFKPLKGITELVLLNACYSALQAQEISRFGMYVIGHTKQISDSAATAFAQGLYIGLSEGKPFEDALNDAMIMLIVASPKAADGVEVWKDGEKLEL
jgi:CHAT domain